MPEITELVLDGLTAIKYVKVELEKVGWYIYRVEADGTVQGKETMCLFLHPIKKEDKPGG